MAQKWNPDQPRASNGQWGAGSGALDTDVVSRFLSSVHIGATEAGLGGAALGAALALFVDTGAAKRVGVISIIKYGPKVLPEWGKNLLFNLMGFDRFKSANESDAQTFGDFFHKISEDQAKRLSHDILANLDEGEKKSVLDALIAAQTKSWDSVMNHFYAPLELKFVDGAPVGLFSGYGAVFGNQDSHGDVIKPGAFAETLAESKAAGRPVPMHLMHRVYGGDGIPVGIWTSLSEDDAGLKVEGKISGMNTDGGRLLFERVKDGALGGLSIGYKVKPDGAIIGKKAGEPKRTLTNLDLREISLVDSPSNALSRVDQIKSAMMDEIKELMKTADVTKAAAAIAGAMAIHAATLTGSNSPTVEDRAALLNHLQDAHEAVTGSRIPSGMKSMPTTIREFEAWLREEFKLSNAQARSIAENGFKASQPRDEGNDRANKTAELLSLLRAS